jgi:hypothetical protein
VPRRLRELVWDLVWETKQALVLDIWMVVDALMLASTVGRAANTCNKASKDARRAQKPTQLLTPVNSTIDCRAPPWGQRAPGDGGHRQPMNPQAASTAQETPRSREDSVMEDLNWVYIQLELVALAFGALQVWWIGSVFREKRRPRPMGEGRFRKALERIWSKEKQQR